MQPHHAIAHKCKVLVELERAAAAADHAARTVMRAMLALPVAAVAAINDAAFV